MATTLNAQQKWQMAGKAVRAPREGRLKDIEVMAQKLIQLQRERDELQKDVEALCMQQAGSHTSFDTAQKIHNRRAVGLEQELSEAKHHINVIERERDMLEEEIEIAYRGKAQVQDSLKEATDRVASLESEVKYFQQQVTELHAEREKTLVELETVRFEQKSMDQALKELYSRQRKLETQMAESEKENLGLRERLEIANVAIDEMHKVMDMLREAGLGSGKTDGDEGQNHQPREIAEALLGERRALQTAHEEGRRKSEKMEKALVAVTSEVSRALEEEREECRHVKAGISQVLDAEKERIARMRLELLQAFQEMRELHAHERVGRIQLELRTKQQEDDFAREKEELEQKLRVLEEESVNRIEDLEAELEAERDERAKEKAQLVEKWEIEQDMRQELETKLQDAEAEVERLKEELETERKERDELEEKLESKNQSYEDLEKVLEELSQKLVDEKMELEREKEDLQNQLAEEKGARSEAEKKVRELHVAIDLKEHQGKRQKQDLEAKIKDLESQLKDMQIHTREVQRELEHERKEKEKALEVSAEGKPGREQWDKFEEQKLALAQAMNEKVATLQILSKHEERQRMDSHTISLLEAEVSDLKEKLNQVTEEKVNALMENADLKKQRGGLQDRVKDQARPAHLQRSASMVGNPSQPSSPNSSAPREISIPASGEIPSSFGGQGVQQLAQTATFMGAFRRSGWFKSASMKRDGSSPSLTPSGSFRRSGSMSAGGEDPINSGRQMPNPTS
ncbi:hypothetical protein CBR_g17833 [Chara braunii]|uniref:Uncharacterized protein n=1 Tax=Chara braunii TaxID=69332 RepID=A0A388KVP4_CHABU|nr:hypothetical protein CBR_g17833 [Chara braunii]|eukprot:GBG74121.1 hypothetical protein CBR_g17833 [Chara braunii]